jgi:hypothetical protein
MKLQAVRFLVERDAFPEYGFACVKEFGLSDVHWIINSKGEVQDEIWTYTLLASSPGHLAEVLPVVHITE